MKTSESVKEIMPVFVDAISKLHNPPKTKKGHNYMYAPLDGILDMVRPVLSERGLALVQSTTTIDGELHVETRIYHKSGEFVGDSIKLSVEKGRMNGMQSLGSAITYARRYSVQNLLCIVGDDDDDGASSGAKPSQNRQQSRSAQPPKLDHYKPFEAAFKKAINGDMSKKSELSEKLGVNWSRRVKTDDPYWLDMLKKLNSMTASNIEL